MLKKLLLFSILAVFLSGKLVLAQTTESIQNFNTQITVNENGTISVTEEIDYFFPTQRHGIFRTIPLSKVNQDGESFLLKVTGISVEDENGVSYQYQNNSTSGELNLKIGDPNKTITGLNTYIISYEVSGALTYFSEHDEILWNITGNDWEVPILNSLSVITLPESVTTSAEGLCYTGAYAQTAQNCVVTKLAENQFEITTQNLGIGEGITFAVKFPKGNVAFLEPTPDRSGIIEKLVEILVTIIAVSWYLLLPSYLIYKAWQKRKKTPEEKRVVAAWFDPPKTSSGRELTAGEVGILHDRKGDVRDITATLIQLAQKGYFKITSEEEGFIVKKPAFTLIKQKEWEGSELMEYEINLLTDIFKGKDVVKLSELSKRIGFATKLDHAYKSISEQLVADGLYEEDPHSHRQKWYGIMFIGFFFFNPLFIVATLLMANSAKRTNLGGGAWATVESMRNFVKSQEKQLEFQAKNQMFFEKLLPYATALGVEKVWIERFKDLELAKPDWLETDNFNTFAYMNMMNSFNTSVSSAVAMSSTRSSSGFSSGFSGGGFSGGGGGGGGGGSW